MSDEDLSFLDDLVETDFVDDDEDGDDGDNLFDHESKAQKAKNGISPMSGSVQLWNSSNAGKVGDSSKGLFRGNMNGHKLMFLDLIPKCVPYRCDYLRSGGCQLAEMVTEWNETYPDHKVEAEGGPVLPVMFEPDVRLKTPCRLILKPIGSMLSQLLTKYEQLDAIGFQILGNDLLPMMVTRERIV